MIIIVIVLTAVIVTGAALMGWMHGINEPQTFDGWTAWLDYNLDIHVETASGQEWIYPMSIDDA